MQEVGGSLEDLWPFNEEITARAIFESEIPIISAVGHETDFTIADFVADLRAPTPSAAGELVVPEINEIKWKIQTIRRSLSLSLNKKVASMRSKYNTLANSKALKNPYDKIRQNMLQIDTYVKTISNKINIVIKNNNIKLIKSIATLETLSPLKTLSRGYCIAENEDKKIIKSSSELKKDMNINLIFNDGSREAKII